MTAEDETKFDDRPEELQYKIVHLTRFVTYVDKILKPKLLKYVSLPSMYVGGKQDTAWTNNNINAESMNNILTMKVDWKPKKTPDLVESG